MIEINLKINIFLISKIISNLVTVKNNYLLSLKSLK